MAELPVSATPVRANALHLPLADESVDLIVSSPPYYALRSYRDGGEHYDGQVGSEPTPQAFLEALWAVTAEAWRVLKPTGSLFVNLGDKRSGSGGHNNGGLTGKTVPPPPGVTISEQGHGTRATRRNAPDRYNQAAFGRPKSKMLLPHRYAIGCEDGLADPDGVGWVVRQDIVWSKLNGLPESVTDRTRDSHEYVFHLTKQGRYFSAVDEVREQYAEGTAARYVLGYNPTSAHQVGIASQGPARSTAAGDGGPSATNPLGKLPGSVWPLASEPLTLSPAVKAHYDLPDHFAAFPQELPRRLVLGWSPSGVCVACGEGRRPVVAKDPGYVAMRAALGDWRNQRSCDDRNSGGTERPTMHATITGYACACPDATAPTRPSVVVDIFGGTGTVAGVARQLGRTGISFDLSWDYSRLAAYFLRDGRRFAKTSSRTDRERQGALAL